MAGADPLVAEQHASGLRLGDQRLVVDLVALTLVAEPAPAEVDQDAAVKWYWASGMNWSSVSRRSGLGIRWP